MMIKERKKEMKCRKSETKNTVERWCREKDNRIRKSTTNEVKKTKKSKKKAEKEEK
jgi:hypothetical protein